MEPVYDEIDALDRRAKLEQFAEECGELAQACLKLIRAEGNGNPCRISKNEAMQQVIEEIADLYLAIDTIIYDLGKEHALSAIFNTIQSTYDLKKERWIEEIKNAKKGEGDDD